LTQPNREFIRSVGILSATRIRLTGLLAVALSTVGFVGASGPFLEQATPRGLIYTTANQGTFGKGLGFVDLDNDGDPDVVALGRSDGRVGIFENDGSGNFTDRSTTNGIPLALDPSGVSAADYDGDGDLDLFLSCHREPDMLLRNDGSFNFANVTLAAGVGNAGAGQGSAWGDYDGDGWLDLYVANRTDGTSPQSNLFYRNQGDGTFVEMADALGISRDDDATFQSAFFDYNGDMSPDLYVCNDHGVGCSPFSNHLFENTGAAFVNVTTQTGTAACVGCMGTGVGDIDGNGYQDLYCTNIQQGNVMLLNQGDGSFTEESSGMGIRSNAIGWGNLMFDHDNDGHLDIYICNTDAPNRLYDCNAGGLCFDAAAAMDVDTSVPTFATSAADIDNDGDLDLLVQGPALPLKLYVNQSDTDRNWLKVDLSAAAPNTRAIGAIVRVRIGTAWQMREVFSNVGFKSVWPTMLHFGMGNAGLIDEVVIEWPDGAVDTLYGVSVNQTLSLQHIAPAAPPAAADGIAGGLLSLGRGSGSTLTVDYDASTCGGDHAVMVWGQIGDWSGYQGDVGATCDLGSSGNGSFDFAGDNVWFNLIWVDGTDVAGHPGFDAAGPRNWSALGLCGVQSDDHSDATCD